MSASNITDDLCRICDGRIECAPTAILLISLVHTLYGHVGPEPDYFGQNKEELMMREDVTRKYKSYRGDQGYRDGPEEMWKESKHYDFIVVGGGTAGCVIASRLSENQNWKVLLVEAGPEEPRMSLIPGLTSEFRGSPLDWQFSMRPKKGFCQNRQDKGCEVVQGRVLGGTSSINDMAYIRGSPADYDEWELSGCDGWAFNKVLPYFKYSEGNYDKDVSKNKFFHSTQGPLDIGRYPYVDVNVDVLLSAFNELGYNYTDVNGRNQLGFMRIQTMSYFGERVKDKVNMGLKGYGVNIITNGTLVKAVATKEIVISAGAINTPRLLMSSGIGPKDYLEYLEIKTLLDLPVGSNFQDHLSVCLPVIKLTNTSTLSKFTEKMKDITTYYTKGIGPLSANFQVVAFLESTISDIIGTPDIEIRFKGHDSNMYYDRVDVCVSLLTPKSRGQVVLNATNPVFGKPLIYPNYLRHPSDEKKLLEGIQNVVKIFDTEVFKSAGVEFDPRPLLRNECRHYERVTEEFWSCIIRSFSSPLHNYVGTCKMGSPKDPEAVVDSNLKVFGTNNIRVADASIMPKITRGPTAAPVIMIAEKASDAIKTIWY
ncbi:glucose dehydrogenase [FAD, quinone]-like isoform X2 [Hyposmocoma kahamanoa]|uniref:glucose dehydrogenase [FAD, quinone]-like isoform X2 n=1 Tax=Hyposmocoma kahamanoa TaxID=1477025 RepID=UPI000E6DA42A|nr:glucose dehydrogenase [FAD, quinone]-like isoform X2 [Hyposmocoma kahamanoa]